MNQQETTETGKNTFTIVVVYNGVEKKLEVRGQQAIQAVLQQAIHLFGVQTQPHMLSLFTSDGRELPGDTSIAAAGLHAGSVVFLRQSVVKGG